MNSQKLSDFFSHVAQLTNKRPLFTGPGNDQVIGDSTEWGILNLSRIYTQAGNDTVTGLGITQDGIYNYEIIDMGTGNDSMIGAGAIGIANNGVINMSSGNNSIDATGDLYGLFNTDRVLTGNRNDSIEAQGRDKGIYNLYRIETGAGNDSIHAVSDPVSGIAIDNGGLISTGDDNDKVDALTGGFAGDGLVSLGRGQDVLKGFGRGYFTGGKGQDQILFGEGTYVIEQIAPSAFAPDIAGINLRPHLKGVDQGAIFAITSGGVEMNVALFESVGGAGSGTFALLAGTLVVDANGVAAFTPA